MAAAGGREGRNERLTLLPCGSLVGAFSNFWGAERAEAIVEGRYCGFEIVVDELRLEIRMGGVGFGGRRRSRY